MTTWSNITENVSLDPIAFPHDSLSPSTFLPNQTKSNLDLEYYSDLSHLRLKYFASSGRLSNVFHATLDQNAVVIKLVDLESFTLSGEPDQYSLDEARTAVMRECDLYLGPLRELQPRFVPRCHGVCVGETGQPWTGHQSLRPVIALVLDDVGEPIAEDWHTIPQELR